MASLDPEMNSGTGSARQLSPPSWELAVADEVLKLDRSAYKISATKKGVSYIVYGLMRLQKHDIAEAEDFLWRGTLFMRGEALDLKEVRGEVKELIRLTEELLGRLGRDVSVNPGMDGKMKSILSELERGHTSAKMKVKA